MELKILSQSDYSITCSDHSFVPNSIRRNPPLIFFVSFQLFESRLFINRPESLRDLTFFKMSLTSLFDIISAVFPDREAPDTKILYDFLRLLLLILMVSAHFYSTALVHSSSLTTRLSLMVQEFYHGKCLTVLF